MKIKTLTVITTFIVIIFIICLSISAKENPVITKEITHQKGTAAIRHIDCEIQPIDLPNTNIIPIIIKPVVLQNYPFGNFFIPSKETTIDSANINQILQGGQYTYFEINATNKSITAQTNQTLSNESEQAILQTPVWLEEQLRIKLTELRKHGLNTEREYASLILNAPFQLKDEVAFVIANSSYQTLTDTRFVGDKQAIVRNAEFIYKYADSLAYVELVEKGNHNDRTNYTTTRYRIYDPNTKDTIWSEIPHSIYYWYIVHPKMDQEGFYVLDNNNDASGQRTYGFAWRQFIWENPDPLHDYRNVNKTTSKGSVITIPRFGELIKQARFLWDRKKTYLPFNRPFLPGNSALDLVGNWCSRALPVDVTLPRAFQPNQILMKHDGMCNEDAFLVAATCRTALIPIIYLGTWSEDHVFGAVWDLDWNHFEFFRGGLSESGNQFYGITNMLDRGSYGWKNAMVEGFRPDGFAVNFTKHYANTCTYQIHVLDSKGYPVEGALINFFSSPNGANNNYFKCGTAYTDQNGYAEIHLGEAKKYLAQAFHPKFGWAPQDSTRAFVIASVNTSPNVVYKANIVFEQLTIEDVSVTRTAMPPSNGLGIHLNLELKNILTGVNNRDSQRSRFYLHNEQNKGMTSVFICDEENLNLFKNKQPFQAYEYFRSVEAANSTFSIPDNSVLFLVISNHDAASHYQSISAKCSLIEGLPASVNQSEQFTSLIISPNPASDLIEISFDGFGIISIFNTLGIKILSVEQAGTVDISHLPAGIYFVKAGNKIIKFSKI